jgi:hypothetical protein
MWSKRNAKYVLSVTIYAARFEIPHPANQLDRACGEPSNTGPGTNTQK